MTSAVANNFSDLLRKFGVAGFAFFFIKGILWLVAPLVIAWLF
ncbi:MAG: hypothetical protein ACR2QU_11775 [Gammaproteobacteria bacterium]